MAWLVVVTLLSTPFECVGTEILKEEYPGASPRCVVTCSETEALTAHTAYIEDVVQKPVEELSRLEDPSIN